jgi:NAD(P)-dependent dehydrogenase (short-subunit alcohol dehydrogenase family)
VGITGASGGIGSAMAKKFVAEGARLVPHYHRHQPGAAALFGGSRARRLCRRQGSPGPPRCLLAKVASFPHYGRTMKKRIEVIILVLVCLGLGVVLVAVKKQAAQEQRAHEDEVNSLSNRLVLAKSKLGEEVQRSTTFEKDLAETKRAFSDLTNTFTQVSANLSQASADLAKTEAALKAKDEEVKKRDAKIADLENQNQALDKRAFELGASITNLTVQIEDTRRRLAASEGDKALLESNLKHLLAEKAELERQFNDITILRTQVNKLKDELTVARRLEWIRVGLFAGSEQKGAQKLIEGINPLRLLSRTPKANYDLNVEVGSDGTVKVIPPPKPNYDLNVEVTSDGGVKVIPPLNTNLPPATNAPPK